MPMPGTPAPSPQASPPPAKQKKQQYQTDPNKPFIFPYSRSSAASAGPSGGTDAQGPTSLVPFAIAEADKLYQRHMYVSLGTYQMWEAREELMREERGLGRAGLIGLDPVPGADEEEAEMAALSRQWKYEEEEQQCFAKGDKEGAAKAKDKLLAAKRLHRVDIVYVSADCACSFGRRAWQADHSGDTALNPADHAKLRDRASQAAAGDSHGARGYRCWWSRCRRSVAGQGAASA